MSRCFPFPPPGYEKKARLDQDENVLIKENQKDKKQKKDKKDKEKKERRDKDEEKSSEKEREKKERKHKHKEKKEKNRDKEEKKSSEERRNTGHLDLRNSEQVDQSREQVGENQNSKLLFDVGKKVRSDNGAKELQIVERIGVADLAVQPLEHNDGILAERIQKTKDKREETRIPNGRHVNSNSSGLANGFVSNFPAKNQKNVGGGNFQEVKAVEKQNDHKDMDNQKASDAKKDKSKDGDREKKNKSRDKKRKKEKEKEKEEEKANELSSQISSKLRESGNNAVDCSNDRVSNLSKESILSHGNLSKRKEPEMDGVLHANDVQSNRLPRPSPASHHVSQTGNRIDISNATAQVVLEKGTSVQRHKSNTKVSSSNAVVQIGTKSETRQSSSSFAPERVEVVSNHNKDNNRLFTSVGSTFGDGRNMEPCGTVRGPASMEQEVGTKPALDKKPLPLPPIENGRKLESSQLNNLPTAEKQGAVSKLKFSDKEPRRNRLVGHHLDERGPSKVKGVVDLKKPRASSVGSSSGSSEHNGITEIPVRPSHPDAKDVEELLAVPKVEWSAGDEVDEQTWLFGGKDHQAKKPRVDSTMMEEPQQVWAEALHVESADVTALPYVITY